MQWRQLMLSDPAGADCPGCPVTLVNWYEAAAFLNARSEAEGYRSCYRGVAGCAGPETLGDGCPADAPDGCDGDFVCPALVEVGQACNGYRLPTEAEWELMARGGRLEPRYGPLAEVARHVANSDGHVWPVGGLEPNAFGLFDVLGNASEWTADRWDGDDLPPAEPETDPTGAALGDRRAHRGGHLGTEPEEVRAAARESSPPARRSATVGFRAVRTLIH